MKTLDQNVFCITRQTAAYYTNSFRHDLMALELLVGQFIGHAANAYRKVTIYMLPSALSVPELRSIEASTAGWCAGGNTPGSLQSHCHSIYPAIILFVPIYGICCYIVAVLQWL